MKEPVTKESKTRRKFDRSFKEEAVAHWLQSSKSAQAIAQELGINANQLYLWKKSFAPELPGGKGGSGAKPSTEELAQSFELVRALSINGVGRIKTSATSNRCLTARAILTTTIRRLSAVGT